MSNLTLPASAVLPRELKIYRIGKKFAVSVRSPGLTHQIAFTLATELLLRPGSLWADGTAFDVLDHEANAISAFINAGHTPA